MDYQILDLQAKELLRKFGAGSHKPGSGSGAALQGMVAACFVRTVAQLTIERQKQHAKHEEFSAYIEEIDDILLPNLEILCQKDSEQFEKVIKARNTRNEVENKNSDLFVVLAARALEELKPATEIPIQIAKRSQRIAELAIRAFDDGFQPARGDSSVALNGAISGIAGCLSIIELNLTSFNHDEWTQSIRKSIEPLRVELHKLKEEELARQNKLKQESETKAPFQLLLEDFRTGTWTGTRLSDFEIEKLSRTVQATIWRNRHKIWNDRIPRSPLQVIHPEIAIKLLGYEHNLRSTLGQFEVSGQTLEVAGIIDHDKPAIDISMQFPAEIQNFTSAHELGHSLLHKQNGLHRDRAVDGSDMTRDWQEEQADWFSSCYLMPRNLTTNMFSELFLTKIFEVNQDTAFALNLGNVANLKQQIERHRGKHKKPVRGLSRLLASHQSYNGQNFQSLSDQLKVSTEAMAIRLEQLGLVKKL